MRFDDSAAFLEGSPAGAAESEKQPPPSSGRRPLMQSGSRSLTSLRRATSPYGRKMARVDEAGNAALGANGSRVDPLEGLEYAMDNPNIGSRKRQR